MTITYPTTATAEAVAIRCILPSRYGDEELTDWPAEVQAAEELVLTLDLDTGRIRDWPHGAGRIYVTVRDEGTYELLAADGTVLRRLEQETYVLGCLPGGGDTFEAEVLTSGTVEGWKPTAREVVEAFWPGEGR